MQVKDIWLIFLVLYAAQRAKIAQKMYSSSAEGLLLFDRECMNVSQNYQVIVCKVTKNAYPK